MNVFIFLGPSLPIERARNLLDAIYLPPVQQGEIIRLLDRQPTAIGIIDGYFEVVPAVWHKEILLAMSRGIHVFGAASMGALRAAELHRYGMVGVGSVFEWYRDGVLTADDEVAVIHGPIEMGYRALSDAMVDIRDACGAAIGDGVLTPDLRDRLVAIAGALSYRERSYRLIAQLARLQCIDGAVVERWLEYVAERGPGRKQLDAEMLLLTLRDFLGKSPGHKQISYQVERTLFLDQICNEAAIAKVCRLNPPIHDHQRLRTGDTLAQLRKVQLLHILGRQEAERLGWRPTLYELQDCADSFREQHGLATSESMLAWMEAEGVTEDIFWRFINDSCLVDRLERMFELEVETALKDLLHIATAQAYLTGRDQDSETECIDRGA